MPHQEIKKINPLATQPLKTKAIILAASRYLIIAVLTMSLPANAEYQTKNKIITNIYKIAKKPLLIGTITSYNSNKGLAIKLKINNLPPGYHGFHLHQFASCRHLGADAGGHWDPKHTHKHLGPYNNSGHLGDLPKIRTNRKGQTIETIYAPRLKLKDLIGHSFIIHAGGDNYQDKPVINGGGGKRIACGKIIKKTGDH